MVLFLGIVVALDWMGLGLPSRVLYAALVVLAGYTGWPGWRAAYDLVGRAGSWRTQYVEDVGFTLIALFDGFVIVSALDLGAPGWLVVRWACSASSWAASASCALRTAARRSRRRDLG